jgi:hypothetical protein
MDPDLQDALDEVRRLGYFAQEPSRPNAKGFGYSKDGKFGYLELGRPGVPFSIFSSHKPNQTSGTGFLMAEVNVLTDSALEAGLQHSPCWASQAERASVVKWKSWEEIKAYNKKHYGGR